MINCGLLVSTSPNFVIAFPFADKVSIVFVKDQ